MNVLERLESKVVCADGAMGTSLLARGASPNACLEALCIESPDIVAQIHTDYINAGAEMIRTNSFGANALRLASHGLEHQINQINWTAAQIARQAAKGTGAVVAGSVGPLCKPNLPPSDCATIFQTQIGALLDGGAQMIFLETFLYLEELLVALEVKQSLHHCPTVCSLVFNEEGRLADGVTMDAAFSTLRSRDADIIGVNCMVPEVMLQVFTQGVSSWDSPLAALPNAGIPTTKNGHLHYPVTPQEFAATALELVRLGARIVGGCCGTTPSHIAALRAAL